VPSHPIPSAPDVALPPSVTAVVDLIHWSFPPDQGRRRLSPSCGVTGQIVGIVLPSPGALSPICSCRC
jgi:hypothetical protein